MRIDILTLFPSMFEGVFGQSIIKRAVDKGHAELIIHDIRDYAANKHKKADDYSFGGGSGMVMMIQPIADCIGHLKKEREYDQIIFLSPDGNTLHQGLANQLSLHQNLILLCGHYKGIDERIREKFITLEISIGDYVLSGGELAAMVLVDSLVRLIPGVLNDETSALTDSFQNHLLSPPVYTRPAEYQGMKVPEILLSGDEAKIRLWKEEQALFRTRQRRPDLLQKHIP